MTKRLTDKQKSDRAYIRQFRKADPQGLGPYNIIWGSEDPYEVRSYVDLDPKVREIHITEPDTKGEDERHPTAGTLAHEIAHTRTLRSFPQDAEHWPEHLTDEDFAQGHVEKMYGWRELEAVLHTLAKGWAMERWYLLAELHDAAKTFGDASLKDAKRIAGSMLESQRRRGHITDKQFNTAVQEVDAIKLDEWNLY